MTTTTPVFGAMTASGAYITCGIDGRWYFHPANDPVWIAGNANDSFSSEYESEDAALSAAELWEAQEAE